jgi:hypothetical protein
MANSLAFRLSGGASNSDPLLSLGGAMSSNAVTANTLFDTVSAAEASPGDVEYRCFYVYNDGTIDLTALSLSISDQPTQGTYAIALDGGGLNATAEGPVADESTAPSGESFGAGPLSLPDLAQTDKIAVWVRRTISASTPGIALGSNTAQFQVDYEYIP